MNMHEVGSIVKKKMQLGRNCFHEQTEGSTA